MSTGDSRHNGWPIEEALLKPLNTIELWWLGGVVSRGLTIGRPHDAERRYSLRELYIWTLSFLQSGFTFFHLKAIYLAAIRPIAVRKISVSRHHGKNNWGSTWSPPYITSQQHCIEGLREALNWDPIMPREVIISGSQCK